MSTKTRAAVKKRKRKDFPKKRGSREEVARSGTGKNIDLPPETAKAIIERSPRQENL